MSILRRSCEPFTALSKAKKLSRNEIVQIAKAAGIKEYGVYNNRFVADEWQTDFKPEKIIGALNNSDRSHMLLKILRENTTAVIEGLSISAYVTGAKVIEIAIPEEDEELKEKIQASAKAGNILCDVTVGLVNVRAEADSIIHHIETAAAITALFEDSESYNGAAVIEVKKRGKSIAGPMEIHYGNTIGEVIGEILKREAKAIGIGTKLYEVSACDYVINENLSLGDGVFTIYDVKSCMADEAEKSILTARMYGCGKCTFCREGAIQIHSILKDITHGKGKPADIDMMKEIGEAMGFSSTCSLGQTASDFTLGVLQNFKDEIDSHIRRKKCPAEVCSAFINIYIDPAECNGCGDCVNLCAENCIEGKTGYIHMIDEFDCTKCGKCMEVCPNNAVIKTTGRLPKLPERLTRVGRFNRH